jgi:hypothetical protein
LASRKGAGTFIAVVLAIILVVYASPSLQGSPQLVTSWTDISVGPLHPQAVSNGFYFGYPFENFSIASIGYRATAGMMTTQAYAVHNMTFMAQFMGGSGALGGDDEMVIFMTNDTTGWQGYEAGLRLQLSDGEIYLYGQFPSPTGGGAVFLQYPIQQNDGRRHTWSIINKGLEVALLRDGKFVTLMFQPTIYVLDFHVVAQCVRWDSGWPSQGWGFTLENVTVS